MGNGEASIDPRSAAGHPGSTLIAALRALLLEPEVRAVWDRSDNSHDLLEAYDRVWGRKGILRELYHAWYQRIDRMLAPGPIVEVGSGIGNFRRWAGERGRRCFSLDLIATAHVDVMADAHALPLRAGAVGNVVMMDVLHHLSDPLGSIHEVARVLRPGGRLILVEPYLSLWGQVVYRLIHHEDVSWRIPLGGTKEAWTGNAAITRLLLDRASELIPLRVVDLEYGDLLAYPLSGGFSYRPLIPDRILRSLARLERRAPRSPLLSLRVLAVLERAV